MIGPHVAVPLCNLLETPSEQHMKIIHLPFSGDSDVFSNPLPPSSVQREHSRDDERYTV